MICVFISLLYHLSYLAMWHILLICKDVCAIALTERVGLEPTTRGSFYLRCANHLRHLSIFCFQYGNPYELRGRESNPRDFYIQTVFKTAPSTNRAHGNSQSGRSDELSHRPLHIFFLLIASFLIIAHNSCSMCSNHSLFTHPIPTMGYPWLSCLLGIIEYEVGIIYFHNSSADFLGFANPMKITGINTIIAGHNSTTMEYNHPLSLSFWRISSPPPCLLNHRPCACPMSGPLVVVVETGIVGIEPTTSRLTVVYDATLNSRVLLPSELYPKTDTVGLEPTPLLAKSVLPLNYVPIQSGGS